MKDPSGEFRETKPLHPAPRGRSSRTPTGLRDRLRRACDGLTLREVAAISGASKEAVRRYLAGSPPSADFLARLCESKECSAEWLLCGIGPESRAQQRQAALGEASCDELYDALMEKLRPIHEAYERERAASEHGASDARSPQD